MLAMASRLARSALVVLLLSKLLKAIICFRVRAETAPLMFCGFMRALAKSKKSLNELVGISLMPTTRTKSESLD